MQFFIHFYDFLAAGEAALAADLITAWKAWKPSGEAALAADLITASRPDGGGESTIFAPGMTVAHCNHSRHLCMRCLANSRSNNDRLP